MRRLALSGTLNNPISSEPSQLMSQDFMVLGMQPASWKALAASWEAGVIHSVDNRR